MLVPNFFESHPGAVGGPTSPSARTKARRYSCTTLPHGVRFVEGCIDIIVPQCDVAVTMVGGGLGATTLHLDFLSMV
jgi:hypothetical protein